MPGSPQSISPSPPPWNEADTIRETTLLVVDDPEDREALRRVGRLLYDLAVETTYLPDIKPGGETISGSELRAAAAELRFLEGYLYMVERSADESSLTGEDDALARFAGRMARKVAAVAHRGQPAVGVVALAAQEGRLTTVQRPRRGRSSPAIP